MGKILADFDIWYQQYYTMSLVGEHIHRLITNSSEICKRTEELMFASVTADEDRDSITTFMGHMLELMEAFDFLCAVMTQTTIQSEDTIAKIWIRGKMVWSQVSGVFQQGCNSECALFGNAPH